MKYTGSVFNHIDSLISANPRLRLQELAQTVGIDRHQIEQEIRERCGFCYGELKRRARLKRVLALLLEENPSRSVKEIAAEVGLTPNHLSRFVRSMTGHRASELRCHK